MGDNLETRDKPIKRVKKNRQLGGRLGVLPGLREKSKTKGTRERLGWVSG